MMKPYSKNLFHFNKTLLLTSTILFTSHVVTAATATTTMPVTATVVPSCNVSAGTLNFGNTYGLGASSVSATASLLVTCTSGTAYGVTLDAGMNAGGSTNYTSRAMQFSTSYKLNYQLYNGSGSSAAILGTPSGTPAGNLVTGATGSGNSQPYTVYGTIPAGQTVYAAGSGTTYTDTVNVIVNY